MNSHPVETTPSDIVAGEHIRLSAITLRVSDMARSVRFYESLGFGLHHGGPGAAFTTFGLHEGALNLMTKTADQAVAFDGRIVFHVPDVDAYFAFVRSRGHQPDQPPRNASWGERYFHLLDPDGHELSFASPLEL